MARTPLHRCVFVLGIATMPWAVLATSGEVAVTSEQAIEQRLREQRPDVLHWQLQALSETASASDAAVTGIGKVGVRTAVRFADGRVRWYAVSGLRDVLVSTHAVERGAAFEAIDAESAERDVVALGCDPLGALDASRRWRTARRLTAGTALCARDIERVPDVERDHPVTVNARRGAINASRVLTADSDAHAGERVRLRDRTSGDVVVAIVTGPGAARLSEEPK
jgi:flagella basal body P-ring formation protein FlgA